MKTNIDLTTVAEKYRLYYTVRETQAMCLHGRYAVEHKYMGVLEHFSSRNQAIRFIGHMVVALARIESRLLMQETQIRYAVWYAMRRTSPHIYDRPVRSSTIHQRFDRWRSEKEREANVETVSFGADA